MAKTMRIRTDDQVVVISGKDAGKTGRVLRTEPKKRRVYVEGLNIIKRHERPRSTGDMATAQPGGIVEKEGPIHVSNVMLLDPKGNKADPHRRPPRRRRQARALREAQRERRSTDGGWNRDPSRRRHRRRACARDTSTSPAGADQEIRLLDADGGAAAW